MPARKAGLWELKMSLEGRDMSSFAMKHRVDAATDKLMNANFGGPANQACAKQDATKAAGAIIVDSVCKFGDATTTSHAAVTGNFESAYTVNVTSTREGGRPLPGQAPGAPTHMTIQATWLGPCAAGQRAAGQRAGDIVMSNGMTMNVLDMPKMGGGLKGL
jgi:hypothetical protein